METRVCLSVNLEDIDAVLLFVVVFSLDLEISVFLEKLSDFVIAVKPDCRASTSSEVYSFVCFSIIESKLADGVKVSNGKKSEGRVSLLLTVKPSEISMKIIEVVGALSETLSTGQFRKSED